MSKLESDDLRSGSRLRTQRLAEVVTLVPVIHTPREGLGKADQFSGVAVNPYRYASKEVRLKVRGMFPGALGVGLLHVPRGVLSMPPVRRWRRLRVRRQSEGCCAILVALRGYNMVARLKD